MSPYVGEVRDAHYLGGSIVVLGGDAPLALPLIQDLEKKGFIVVTSVATPEAADELESRCNGYVRALVLDPVEVTFVFPVHLRGCSLTVSLIR